MIDRQIDRWIDGGGEIDTSRHGAVQCRNARLVQLSKINQENKGNIAGNRTCPFYLWLEFNASFCFKIITNLEFLQATASN
jgi:hypothetical protein